MDSKHKIKIPVDNTGVAASQPVILIGRGGSGTRLLSEMVLSLGFFLGNKLNKSFDSVEWIDILYELAIENISHPLTDQSAQDLYWRRKIQSHAIKTLEMGDHNPSDFWGWKLPETTLIVPQIMRYFPQARFVHLVRHPVSTCCRRTHMTSRLNNQIGATVLPAAYTYIGRSPELIKSDPKHINNAASWVYQIGITLNALDKIADRNNRHLIKFENICNATASTMDGLKKFLKVRATQSTRPIEIDKERLNSETHNRKDAAEVWSICEELATKLGYQWASPA